ncbi:MAG: hypothetical protein KJZ80_16140 [Hyphomicrobiaceae bacterium]|nr:hypothetical protein [Hyphomicrobiaceae bacterium]
MRQLVATAIGVGLVGYSAHLAWEHYQDPSAPIAATVGAGMLHFGEVAWRSRERLRSVAFIALSMLAVAISLTAALDRVASAKDAAIQSRQSENLARNLAQTAADDARAALETAEAAALAECKTGRGPKCLGLEARADAARQRAVEARAALANAGAQIAEDSGAARLATVLPFTAAQISLYQPLMLPVWLELGGILMLTFGLSRPTQAKEVAPIAQPVAAMEPAEMPAPKAAAKKRAARKKPAAKKPAAPRPRLGAMAVIRPPLRLVK